MTTAPRHVRVYGNDHSPWVQAVLLGLHEAGIDHALETAPPWSVFWASGVLMPAAQLSGQQRNDQQIDDPAWQLDSGRILAALGYSEVDAKRQRALGQLFMQAAMHRVDDPWQFWERFSHVSDGDPSRLRQLWNHVWRAFPVFYFFVLISLGRRRVPNRDEAGLLTAFERIQADLPPDGGLFGGTVPDTADLQLFGIVQMCASIPGLPLAVLREAPSLERLRRWITTMQERFHRYRHLYTAQVFEPKAPAPREASAFECALYWVGAALCWIALPISLALVLWFTVRIRRHGLV
ncbi:MAG: hypothetical protein AAF430_01155 [Myxococcota bacterium]